MISNINKRSYYPIGSAGLNVKMPSVPNLRTRGQCKLSEKELVKKIKDLALRDAAAGENSQYARSFHGVRFGSAEWIKLREDFISFGSPNRMGIVKKTMSSLANKAKSLQPKGDGRLSFFDIIFKNSKKFGSDVKGNFISFKDEQGNEIARYSDVNGWSVMPTPSESARSAEFTELWKQALADAQAELGQDGEMSFTV